MSRWICRLIALSTLLSGVVACDAINSIGPEICRRPLTDEPVVYEGGEVIDGTYMSSDWGVESIPNGDGGGETCDQTDPGLLFFPGGAYYKIHHGLGEMPRGVQLFLSFSNEGVCSSSLAPAAGNQTEIKDIDAEYITILNGSCVDYSLLVIVWGANGDDGGEGPATGTGGSGGAGGAGGA